MIEQTIKLKSRTDILTQKDYYSKTDFANDGKFAQVSGVRQVAGAQIGNPKLVGKSCVFINKQTGK